MEIRPNPDSFPVINSNFLPFFHDPSVVRRTRHPDYLQLPVAQQTGQTVQQGLVDAARALAGTEDQHRGAGRGNLQALCRFLPGNKANFPPDGIAHRLHLGLGENRLPPHTPNKPA